MIERIQRTERRAPPGALDGKIANVLGAAKPVASDDLEILLGELDTAIAETAQHVQEERDRSVDPLLSPDQANEAHSRATVGELRLSRYKTARPRIEQKLQEALAHEYAERWDADYARVAIARDTLAQEFSTLYPTLVNQLVDLFKRMTACEVDCQRVNSSAPDDEQRRLRGVECVARDRAGFNRVDPSILETVQLPEWKHAGTLLWPVKKEVPFAVSYALSMQYPSHTRGISGPIGPDWEKPEIRERFAQLTEKERADRAQWYQRETDKQEKRQNEEHERFSK